jgi:hypothetical protein
VGLRIQIDKTDPVSHRRDGSREIDGCRRLAYPTLLVDHGDGTH